FEEMLMQVLETLSKNCGDNVHLQIVERDILHEMVKIVKKRPELNVREKILILIDTWQEAFGGPAGRSELLVFLITCKLSVDMWNFLAAGIHILFIPDIDEFEQFYESLSFIQSAGVEFPPRVENAVPLFTPPQTQPIMAHSDVSSLEAAAIEASLQSNVSDLSLAEIKNARGIADVLSEILSALDSSSPEGLCNHVSPSQARRITMNLKQKRATDFLGPVFNMWIFKLGFYSNILLTVEEMSMTIEAAPFLLVNMMERWHGANQEVIVDLVDQCQSYQKRVMLLINNTTRDEELLCQGLTLNDELQRVLCKYDDILEGAPRAKAGQAENPVAPLVRFDHEDDEPEDDLSQLAHRSSRENALGQGRKPATTTNQPTYVSPFVPSLTSSKKAGNSDFGAGDYPSGDAYGSERPSQPPRKMPDAVSQPTNYHGSPPSASPLKLSSPPSHQSDSISFPVFARQPDYVEPLRTTKSADQLPTAPWETSPTNFLPPPPSKYNQRQQYFEQQHTSTGGASHAGGSGFSYDDGLVGQTQNLSLNQRGSHVSDFQDSSPPVKQAKPEDSLFRDLVDIAKAKSSSSAKPTTRPLSYLVQAAWTTVCISRRGGFGGSTMTKFKEIIANILPDHLHSPAATTHNQTAYSPGQNRQLPEAAAGNFSLNSPSPANNHVPIASPSCCCCCFCFNRSPSLHSCCCFNHSPPLHCCSCSLHIYYVRHARQEIGESSKHETMQEANAMCTYICTDEMLQLGS
ncbi:hypothetical protein ACLOJK_013980, partial [Asimina triloba]